jgi:endonuclease/exonuclease/phosphatase (EEP) superfamily protein YafD
MSERALRFARTAIAIASVVAAVAVVVVCVPVWPFVLVEHFRVQLAIGAALVATAGFALRARSADLAAIATLVTLIAIVPDLSAPRRDVVAGTPVRLLSLNVLTENLHYAKAARLIADERPDVIALVEVNRAWLDALAPSVEGYARIEASREDHFGVALYVRGQVRGEVRELTNGTPNIFAEASVDGAVFRVVVVHPTPPMSGRLQNALMRYFAELGAEVRGDPRVVVAGDFNATPWSRTFATMMNTSRLCDTRAGFGVQATRPADGWLLRIPIDHVLTSCAIGVRDRRIGPDVGSDHLPVVVDLVIPPSR